jgi:hypothetical protein
MTDLTASSGVTESDTWPALPDLEWPETAGFWRGLAEGELRLPKCRSCGRFQWYPLPSCPACHSLDFAWTAVAPSGVVFSYTVVRRPFLPGIADLLPLTIYIVIPDDAPNVHVLALAADDSGHPADIGDVVDIRTRRVAPEVFLPTVAPRATGQPDPG